MILFRDHSGGRIRLTSIGITTGPEPKFSAPHVLFDWDPTWAPYYSASADASRFVTTVPVDKISAVPSPRVVQNWVREFAK